MGSHAAALGRAAGRLKEEFVKTSRHPSRMLNLFKSAHRASLVHSLRAGAWDGEGVFQQRRYAGYGEYVRHQVSKPPIGDADRHHEVLRASIGERVAADALVRPGSTALCLGARSDAEVMAFSDRGCFAVGIDIHPENGNARVVPADFHHLPFRDASVDVVFTNSLDHAFDIDVVRDEMVRVLRPGALVIVEAVRGAGEGHPPGFYESFYWRSIDDLVTLLSRPPLSLERRYVISRPWDGEHIVLIRE